MGVSQAQEIKSKKGETYLPKSSDWSIAFNANNIFRYLGNSFNANVNNAPPTLSPLQFQNVSLLSEFFPIVSNSSTFVGKKMISDNRALRAIANFEVGSGTYNVRTEDNVNGIEEVEVKLNTFQLSAGLGKEWRKGITRLQGFYGADVMLNLNSFNYETGEEGYGYNQSLGGGIMLNGFLGAEYFVFPKMAIGVQYNYNLRAGITGKFVIFDGVERQEAFGNTLNLGGIGASSFNLSLYF